MAKVSVLDSSTEKQENEIIITETVERKLTLKDCFIIKQDCENRIAEVDRRIERLNEQKAAIQEELTKTNGYISQLNQ